MENANRSPSMAATAADWQSLVLISKFSRIRTEVSFPEVTGSHSQRQTSRRGNTDNFCYNRLKLVDLNCGFMTFYFQSPCLLLTHSKGKGCEGSFFSLLLSSASSGLAFPCSQYFDFFFYSADICKRFPQQRRLSPCLKAGLCSKDFFLQLASLLEMPKPPERSTKKNNPPEEASACVQIPVQLSLLPNSPPLLLPGSFVLTALQSLSSISSD